jgi:S1-C subfamily serine protease
MSGSPTSQPFDPYYHWLGIPQTERPISFYRLLGVAQFESNAAVIESAVDQRLAFLRTKALGPHAALAEKLMSEIAQARLVLLDPAKKRAYDAALTEVLRNQSHSAPSVTVRISGSQSPWAAGPVPLESHTQGRFLQRRRKSRQTDVLVALGLSVGLFFLVGLAVLFFRQRGASPVGDSARPSNRANLAEGPRQPANGLEKEKSEVAAPQPVAGPQVPVPVPPEQDNLAPPAAPDLLPPNEPAVMPFAGQHQAKRWLDKVRRATVVVEGHGGQGSGFLVQTATGKPVVVTNAHVLRDNRNIRIRLFDGREFPIRQAAILEEFDLAFLAVDNGDLPDFLELRNELPEVSEPVYAYGAPRGLTGTLTTGIVSAVRQSSEIREAVGDGSFDEPVRMAEAHWVQTTAPISPGNSGGPLLDEEGRVVGINTLGFSNRLGQNLNFALSSVEVVRYLAAPRFADLPRWEGLFADAQPGLAGEPDAQRLRPETLPGSYPFESYQCRDIVLPSGAVFQSGKVRPPENWRQAVKSGHVLVCCRGRITVSMGEPEPFGVRSPFAFYVEYDDNEVMRAALAFEKGLLNGPAILFDESGDPYVIANYYRGTRTGPLVVYDEEQYPVLYVDFTRNRKHGLVCVFEQHLPRWIENWKANQQVEACLVNWQAGQPQVLLQSALSNPDDLALTRELMAKVSRYLEALETLESEMKRDVAESFRWADNEIKSRRAAEFSAAATAAILARHRAREAAGAAVRAEAQARFQSGSSNIFP